MRHKLLLCFSAALLLSGCSGPAALKVSETDAMYRKITEDNVVKTVPFNPEEDLNKSILYAQRLSEAYINYSDNVSAVQDLAAMTVVGATSVAASAVLFDFSPNVWKTAGLIAGATGALWNYSKPGEQRTLALRAAEKMSCIAGSGNYFLVNAAGATHTDRENAKLLVLGGVQSVRIDLRKGFTAKLPGYEVLLRQLVTTGNQTGAFVAGDSSIAVQLKMLQESIVTCRAIAGT